MDSPVAIVKSQLNVSTILKGAVLFVIVAAIFDFAGITDYLLYPVSSLRRKFGTKAAA